MAVLNSTSVHRDVVEEAVKAVRKLVIAKEKSIQFKNLLADENTRGLLAVKVDCIKLPVISEEMVQHMSLKIPLPYSWVDDETDVCLITPDLDKSPKADYDSTVHFYKDLLLKNNAQHLITEIIPLRQLKTDYKDFAMKRALSNRCDLVLCDTSIIRIVPQLLGRNFYRKKKIPVKVNLKSKYLQKELSKKLSLAHLHISFKGQCSMVKIGRMSQSDNELTENILSLIRCLEEEYPGGWNNIRCIDLYGPGRPPVIPLYVNLDYSTNIEEPVMPKRYGETVVGEFSLLGEVVQVDPTGNVSILKKNKRLASGVEDNNNHIMMKTRQKKLKMMENK